MLSEMKYNEASGYRGEFIIDGHILRSFDLAQDRSVQDDKH